MGRIFKWLKGQLEEAKKPLFKYVPATSLRCRLVVDPFMFDCRYCMNGKTIRVAAWWAAIAYALGLNVDRWLRHELGHILADQVGEELGVVITEETSDLRRVMFAVGLLPTYGSISPEEQFAEEIADLHEPTMKRVAQAFSR